MISNYLSQGMARQVQPELKDVTSIARAYGENGMASYPVAPGHTVLLIDPDMKAGCLKTTDYTGRTLPLRHFSYTEINYTQNNNVIENSEINSNSGEITNNQNESKNFVTSEELNDFKSEFEKEVKGLNDTINDIKKLLEDFMS